MPTAASATSQPTGGPLEADPAWLAMLYRDQGSAIARIQIPAIGVDKTVVEGVRVGDLRKGPGHYPTTPLPGQAGNAGIAGHRTTYGAPFGDIDELRPGDQIIVTTIQGEFTYEVVPQGEGHGHFIVAPHQVEVLDQDFSDHPNRLTLTACHPKRSARQRIIVVAALVGDPAPTYPRPGRDDLAAPELASENVDGPADAEQTVTPTPGPAPSEEPEEESESEEAAPRPESTRQPEPTQQVENTTPAAAPPQQAPEEDPSSEEDREQMAAGSFGEGLDGDSDGLVPAVLWGLAALSVWLFALFAGQRWRRLPAYALSAVPFLVVLFMAFWHIDRVLPSY
ncbi:MAG: class E sortase [bacterium]|nr:class E sortase [bacterium]